MNCPACFSEEDGAIANHGPFVLIRCRQCGLVFSSPMRGGSTDFYQHHVVYRDADGAMVALHTRSAMRPANRRLLARVPRGGRVLDIGCGVGAFVSVAVAAGLDAHGIDFNEAQIAAGRRHLSLGDRLRVGEVSDLEAHFGKESFDLVTLFEVIEHVEAPAELLTQVRRLLRPAGLIALSCPNEARWMPTGRVFVDYPPHHLTRWRPDTLRSFLARHDFDHVATEIESSARDLLWVAYVNWSAKRKASRSENSESPAPRERPSNIQRVKLAMFETARWASWPFDLLLRGAGVGTMGMRMIARKRSTEKS